MAKLEKVETMVEGGKASAAPPLGPALGPLGVNIGQVISEINKKTGDFKGMKVPIKVLVDPSTKEFTVEVGTPPSPELIKKEVGIDAGSGEPNRNKVAFITVEQLIKLARMKKDSLLTKSLKSAVKTLAGTCNSMGILVEGKTSAEFNKELDSGMHDGTLNAENTEPAQEKVARLKAQLDVLQAEYAREVARKKAAEEAAAAAAAAAGTVAGEEKKEGEKAAAPAAGEKKDAATPAAAKKEAAPAKASPKK